MSPAVFLCIQSTTIHLREIVLFPLEKQPGIGTPPYLNLMTLITGLWLPYFRLMIPLYLTHQGCTDEGWHETQHPHTVAAHHKAEEHEGHCEVEVVVGLGPGHWLHRDWLLSAHGLHLHHIHIGGAGDASTWGHAHRWWGGGVLQGGGVVHRRSGIILLLVKKEKAKEKRPHHNQYPIEPDMYLGCIGNFLQLCDVWAAALSGVAPKGGQGGRLPPPMIMLGGSQSQRYIHTKTVHWS